MHSCPECRSTNLVKRGTRLNKSDNIVYQQYACRDCTTPNGTPTRFQVGLAVKEIDNKVDMGQSNIKKFVFTSAQNDTQINEDFFNGLINYCNLNNAELYVLKSTYNADKSGYVDFGIATDYVVDDNFDIGENIRVYAALNILATAESPLAGLDGLSKGKSLIVGHSTLQMKTLPVFGDDHPIMLTTTGSISYPNFSNSKSGFKASDSHSFSAVVIEYDDDTDIFHVRVLKADEDNGFYDLEYYYTPNNRTRNAQIKAIVLGDTHVTEMDDLVYEAVFGASDSLINTLKPQYIVHHDLLDFGVLQSHHNAKKFLTRYQLFAAGDDDIEAELDATRDFLVNNTPDFVTANIIVASNHNEHLEAWLNNAVTQYDYKNAKMYHYLMFRTLYSIEKGIEINPFKFYFEDTCENETVLNKTRFLGREELYFVNDILVSSHGDLGNNGSKFSPTQGKNLPYKMVVGHSHSPSINKDCYTVGTLTGKVDYAKGRPSSWMNTVCLIHRNGERQLVSIIKGKWRG